MLDININIEPISNGVVLSIRGGISFTGEDTGPTFFKSDVDAMKAAIKYLENKIGNR